MRLLRICFLIGAVVLLNRGSASADDAGAVFQRLTEAMGGTEAYNASRYMLFRFVVDRGDETVADYEHAWDRHTGDYRLTGTNQDGEDFIVLFNIHDYEKGVAWVNGKQLDGEELSTMLFRAYQRFINDSYWLIMPWKWEDPGVHLTPEGSQELNGKSYDVVKLAFDDGTGLTSGDNYWAYVAEDTGLMEYWGYILQDSEAEEPSMWTWTEWEDAGEGVLLSRRKHNAERDFTIRFPQAELTDAVPEGTFSRP